MATPDSLHVRRHMLTYRCTDQHSAARATSGLDEALNEGLAAHLGEAMAAVDAPGGSGVWLIRRLDLLTTIGEAWSTQRITKAVARSVAAEVARTVSAGADGTSVIWFPDRATFVARYLGDVACGRAQGRWEYAEFGCNGPADAAAAILAVMRDAPGDVIDALRRFSVNDIDAVLRTMRRNDAVTALGLLAAVAEASPHDPVEAVVGSLPEVLATTRLDQDLVTLALFVRAVRSGAEASARTAASAAQTARLATTIGAASPDHARRLADAISDGSWSGVDAHLLADLAPMASWPHDTRAAAVASVLHATHGSSGGTPAADESVTTRLGGMLLLLPLLDELPWKVATATWPPVDGIDAGSVAKFVVMVAALGSERNAIALSDPLLRVACGVPAALAAGTISSWLEALSPDSIRAFETAMVRHLATDGRVSGELVLAATDNGIVVVDGKRGLWIATTPDDPESIRSLATRLRDTFDLPITLETTEAWIGACLDPLTTAGGNSRRIDAIHLADLGRQTTWATLGPPFELSPMVSSTVLSTAQTLLRELAWRLPGLAHSSLSYLWQNVLACSASVEFRPEQIVAVLSPAPMHMLLSITGMNRRQFLLEATGSRPWILSQA